MYCKVKLLRDGGGESGQIEGGPDPLSIQTLRLVQKISTKHDTATLAVIWILSANKKGAGNSANVKKKLEGLR